MNNNRFAHYAGPAAVVVGIVSIIGFIALMLFFGIEAPHVSSNPQGFHFWGFLSDVAGPATMIPLIVVMLALHERERAHAPGLSRAAVVIGVVGALGVTLLQVLLIVKVLSFEQEVGPVVVATAITGVWLVLANYLGQVQRILPARLAWLGIAVGAVQIAYPVVFQVLGGANFYQNAGSNVLLAAIAAVIFLVSYIGFPVWALWLARVWSSRRVKADAEMAYAH